MKGLILSVILGMGGVCAMANVEVSVVQARGNVMLTIYGPQLTLVQEERTAAFSKGANSLAFTWSGAGVDPNSVHFEAVEPQDAWTVRGVTLPAGANSMIWEIESKRNWLGQVRFTYHVTGFEWDARYEAFANSDETEMELTGWVSITNGTGEAYRDARVRLVLGSPRLAPPRLADVSVRARAEKEAVREEAVFAPLLEPAFEREGFADYSIFTLKRAESLEPGQTRRSVAVESPKVRIHRYFVYDPRRYGDRVAMLYEFRNSKENGLGEPLPSGVVRLYRRGTAGDVALVGEDTIRVVPADEDVKLHVGSAGNVVVERKLMDSQRLNEVFDEKRQLVKYDLVEQYSIAVRNRRETPAQVRVVEHITPPWTMLEQSHKFEREAADTIRFDLKLDANSTETITYKVSRHIVAE